MFDTSEVKGATCKNDGHPHQENGTDNKQDPKQNVPNSHYNLPYPVRIGGSGLDLLKFHAARRAFARPPGVSEYNVLLAAWTISHWTAHKVSIRDALIVTRTSRIVTSM
ncbi:MAG TPA: hypothetical protein VKY92_16830 [Verrucomicrobiae bacterium]|nr:hypothetical protein [Verrucomicrobiae bacterium]